jgi:AcrR family transcriptional regulator
MQAPISRRDQNKLDVRGRLLQAATAMLSEKPLEEVTVDELCDLAQVSKKTFYNHYPSKQDLIEGISQKLLIAESEKNYAAAIAKYQSTRDRLEYFLIMQGKNLSDSQMLERNLIRHAMLDLSVDSDRSRQKLENTIAIYERMFIAGQALGDINDNYSSRFLAEMVAGAVNTSAIHWIHFPDYPLNERFRELKQLILDIAIKPPAE